MILEIAFCVIFAGYIGAAYAHIIVLEERYRRSHWR